MDLNIDFQKCGFIWVVTKGREVRKHFAVLDKITQQLIFYDIISIIRVAIDLEYVDEELG